MKRALPLVTLAVLLTGCSQVAALAPVGGDHLAEVRFAANDVLVSSGIDILVAPVCTSTDTAISCSGTTVDGEEITAISTDADPTSIEVSVGDTVLFSGAISDVIDSNARPSG